MQMDATQLSLFLTAKLQSSSKMTLQLNDDSNGADKVFADLLKKHAEESQQERQTELDRQNWRNQPPSYTPSTVSKASSATAAYSSTTDNSRPASTNTAGSNATASASAAATRSTRQTGAQSSSTSGTAPQQRNATQNAATDDQGTTTSGRKPDKTKDASGTDDGQTAGNQPGLATADSGTSSKHPAASEQGSDGENASGNGQNQGQPGQDDSQKPQQADGNSDSTAAATVVEGAILAGLMTGQPIIANTGTQATTGGVQAAGTNAGGTTLGGLSAVTGTIAGSQGETAAQGTIAAAAAQANAAMANSLSAAGAAASGQATAGADLAATQGLPPVAGSNAAGTAGMTNRQSPQDLAASFASMVAKTTSSNTANGDGGRISITKTDGTPQMPKPLVKIDNDHTALSTTEPTAASTESGTTGADATAALGAGIETSDDGSDDFRSFSSYSPLLAGSTGSGLIGKPADPLAALRQQLANASVQDQVAVHLQRAVKDSVDKISIQLSPTELGQIHVKMKVDDDKNVTATITVERPATLDLLQRDTKTLERALQEAGLKTDTGSLSFSLQRGNQGDSSDTPGWGQGNGRRIGSSGQENSAGTAEISAATAGNQVDTANGLVNVAV